MAYKKKNTNELKHTKGVQIMNSKIGKVLTQDKLNFVFDLYLQEYKTAEIVKGFVDKFGDTERNAGKYISKVKKQIKEITTVDNKALTNKVALQYLDLYNKNMQEKRYKDAADCLNKYTNLLGLEAPKKFNIEQTVKSIDLSKLSDDMINQLLSEGFDDAVIVD